MVVGVVGGVKKKKGNMVYKNKLGAILSNFRTLFTSPTLHRFRIPTIIE